MDQRRRISRGAEDKEKELKREKGSTRKKRRGGRGRTEKIDLYS